MINKYAVANIEGTVGSKSLVPDMPDNFSVKIEGTRYMIYTPNEKQIVHYGL